MEKNPAAKLFIVSFLEILSLARGRNLCFASLSLLFIDKARDERPKRPVRRGNNGSRLGKLKET
jgi:hypothetical protein